MTTETILVVDDNRQLADFIAHKLLPSMGFEGRCAYSGRAALELLKHLQPALLILDMELPDTTGLDLLRSLKNDGLAIPAILFTAHGSEQVAAEAFRLGVQDYLIKPVGPEQLAASISTALTETHLRQETQRLTVELQDQVAWLSALSKIGQDLTSTLDIEEVLRRIVGYAVQLTQAEEGFIAMLDHATGQLYLRAVKNLDEAQSRSIRLPVTDELISQAIRTGRPVRKSSETRGALIKVSTGLLAYSLVHVPLFSRGRPLGVLSVNNRSPQRIFSHKDEIMLASLAGFAAISLENANLYQKGQHELSERKRAEAALRQSEERYALALQGANDGIWDMDLRANRVYFSTRWKTMLGYQDNEIGDQPEEWFNRVHPQDITRLKADLLAHISGSTGAASNFENEHRMLHKDGAYRWMLSRGLAVRTPDGQATRLAGSQTDISQRKQVEGRLQHAAYYDTLTGLPNRALMLEHLEQAILRSSNLPNYRFAVLFLDLDQFKNINDSLGHPAGDQLLIEVARLLKTTVGQTDLVARLGGDEFIILLDDIAGNTEAETTCRVILQRLTAPIPLGETTVFISTSIGVVLSSQSHAHAEDVLRDADIAMYAAKARGKSTFTVFDPAMREQLMQRISMEASLKLAVTRQQLSVYYQPVIELQAGRMVGMEALVHWQHPELGLLEGKDFMPVAQEAGLVMPIDWWVIEEACRQAHAWHEEYPASSSLHIHINLTGALITCSDLLERIQNILTRTGLQAQNLSLEIAENAAMTNPELTAGVLAGLKQMGIGLQMDDFGTGSSALRYLKRFGFDVLKVETAFIGQIGPRGENLEIARILITLAHELGMKTVAEGIETRAQLAHLRLVNCDYGQGFLFSKSLSPQDFAALLENPNARHPWQAWWPNQQPLPGLSAP